MNIETTHARVEFERASETLRLARRLRDRAEEAFHGTANAALVLTYREDVMTAQEDVERAYTSYFQAAEALKKARSAL